MRRIREARNLSVADVNEETKIPRGLIEAFEEKALFDHPQFNRVYLRSFVRTYAQVIAIDADVALEALEEALSSRYAGSLAVEYLDEEPDIPDTETSQEEDRQGAETVVDGKRDAAADHEASEAESDRQTIEKDDGDGERPSARPAAKRRAKGSKKKEARSTDASRDADTSSVDDAAGEMPPESESSQESRRSFVSTTQATAAGFQKTAAEKEEAGESREGERDDRPAYSSGSRKATGYSAGTPGSETPSMRRVVVGAAVVIVVAILIWMLSSVIGGSDDAEPLENGAGTETVDPAQSPGDGSSGDLSPDNASPDNVVGSQGVSAPSSGVPAVIPTLGDSMSVRIVALYGRVDPIRVTVDDDLRRPYWIPRGDSMTFHPAEQIVIESLLDSVDVKLEGIRYPKNRVDDEGRIVITRDTALDYFSSLRGDQ